MKSFSLIELASHIQAEVIGDAQTQIHRVAPIAQATSGDIVVIKSKSYLKYASQTQASAIILKKDDAVFCKTNALIVDNPELAFIKIIRLFHPEKKYAPGVHATAVIAKTAKISEKAHIGAYAVVGEHTTIADHAVIEAHATIGDHVVIQSDCHIYPHVTIYDGVVIGSRVIVHSGVVIGADGFGMANNRGKWEKIPQVGSVVIGDDVEIGANTCIDRGALKNTIIESGVKIDNLVMIAHNVHIGANTVIAGSTAIAGSTIIGQHCIIGGAVTIGDHLTICDNVIFTGCAMVTSSVTESGMYSSGTGLFPSAVWRRVVAKLRRSGMKREE